MSSVTPVPNSYCACSSYFGHLLLNDSDAVFRMDREYMGHSPKSSMTKKSDQSFKNRRYFWTSLFWDFGTIGLFLGMIFWRNILNYCPSKTKTVSVPLILIFHLTWIVPWIYFHWIFPWILIGIFQQIIL